MFGPGSGPVVLDKVKCPDYERSSFHDCDKDYFPKSCVNPGAAVRCLQESYADPSDSIRLVGGDSPYEGRIELNVNGIWASVCSRQWDIPNSNVACYQMGFGPAIHTKAVSYGNGDGPVFISDVRCRGNESSLLDCRHEEIGMEDCEGDNRDDVGVRCSHPADLFPIRLRAFRGSHSQQGIVEINVNNRWGSICTPTWSEANSNVVCRGLGLGPPQGRAELPSPQLGGDDYPYVYSPPVLQGVNCDGSEPHLAFCSHTPWLTNSMKGPGCVTEYIVSITCGKPLIKDFSLRLHNASSSYDGHVEIFYQNNWGAVCSNEWTLEDATVACKQIKLGTPDNFYTTILNEEAISAVVDYLKCTGNETYLNECDHTGFGRRSCTRMEIAAITCSKPSDDSTGMMPVRLVDGKTHLEGRVEIFYNSTWGSVCDHGEEEFGLKEGDVACRQLGYGPAIRTTKGSHYEPDTEERRTVTLWLGDIECVGSEVMLAACSHSQWGMANCNTDQEAGVKCAESGSISITYNPSILAMYVTLILTVWTVL